MHGLINKSVQGFLTATYGPETWAEIAEEAGVPEEGFEAMLVYPDGLSDDLLRAAAHCLDRDEATLLEDIGTYLVTHPDLEAVRRLMRFGGPSFGDFILSLDELHERAALAVPDLELPSIQLVDNGSGQYCLQTTWRRPGAVALLTGLLNAMADDYGALVVLSPVASATAGPPVQETLEVFLAEHDFAEGRSFFLGEVAV